MPPIYSAFEEENIIKGPLQYDSMHFGDRRKRVFD